MDCLYCGLEARIEGEYQGIPLLVCPEGHRTGVLEEEIPQMDLKVASF